jgi:hypothetical protein
MREFLMAKFPLEFTIKLDEYASMGKSHKELYLYKKKYIYEIYYFRVGGCGFINAQSSTPRRIAMACFIGEYEEGLDEQRNQATQTTPK